VALVSALPVLSGCQQGDPPPPAYGEPDVQREATFGPASMRIHPIFTQVKDWTGDGKADGIEVLLEFQDQFGDPGKAQGRVMFELYDFRRGPDPRGKRVVNPWVGSLATVNDQRAHWNRTSRTYTFQLAYPDVNPRHNYVMVATFERTGGGRFFDRVVLEGTKPERPATKPVGVGTQPHPSTAPATRP
jgi:hypothetical protein